MSHLPSRDDRRRRLLNEESTPAAAPGKEEAATATSPRRATAATRGAAQRKERIPRITDIVPRSTIKIALAFFAGITLIAGLEALYYYSPKFVPLLSDVPLKTFELDGDGCLASWHSSTLLLLSSLSAVLVYLVRRLQPDDYHGRYRVWLWGAACWMFMSLDEGANLHEVFRLTALKLTGGKFSADGSVWWIGAYGLVLSVVGLRLMLEMRRCLGSTASLLLAAVCYAGAAIAQMKLFIELPEVFRVMVEEGCELVGNTLLLLAMTLHARYATVQHEEGYPKKASKPGEAETKRTRKRGDETGATPASARRSDLAGAKPAVSTTPAATKPGLRFDQAEDPADRKLSKSDRRAIRREMRDQEQRDRR